MINHYSSSIPTDHDSEESVPTFDPTYNPYYSHMTAYSDYPTSSKIEAIDYNYWPPTSTPSTTHNILINPTLDQTPGSSSTIETLGSVHLPNIHSSAILSSTHHHHHLHQHLYPTSPTCHDSSNWVNTVDYQSLNSPTNPSSYRHYSTPCSFYSSNNFYDPSQPQWTSPPTTLPIKFESPYTPSPSYFESSDSLNQIPKEEPTESFEQRNWLKPQSSSSTSSSAQLTPIPPKNPLNGNQLTFKRERISKRALIETRASTLVLDLNMI